MQGATPTARVHANQRGNPSPAPEGTSRRALGPDVLRALAALAVVVLHASADPLTQASLQGRAALSYLLPNLIARFAVPAFVLLSGLGLSLSQHQNARYLPFLARRVSKILPAYVVWSVFYSWAMPAGPDSATLQGCVRELLEGTASYHLYFVTTILRLYVWYRAILYLVQRLAWGAAALCVLSWLMIWLQSSLSNTAAGSLLLAIVPLRWLGYFALGARIAQLGWAGRHGAHASSATTRQTALFALLALVSLALLTVSTRYVVAHTRSIGTALDDAEWLILPYTLGIVGLVLGLQYRPSWQVRALGFVSEHSYGIYLSHVLMLKLASIALSALGNPTSPELSFAGALALGLLLSIVAGFVSDRCGGFCRQQLAAAWMAVRRGPAA